MRIRILTSAALLLPLCGCKVGPNYKRPTLDVPGQYRGIAPGLGAGENFGEMKWQSVFPDEALQGLIGPDEAADFLVQSRHLGDGHLSDFNQFVDQRR